MAKPYFFSGSTAGAAAPQLQTTNIPKDRVLILGAITARWTPGAGQIFVTGSVRMLSPDQQLSATIAQIAPNPVPVAVQTIALNWSGTLILPKGWNVICQSLFNGGAANLLSDFAVHGVTIPPGTIDNP